MTKLSDEQNKIHKNSKYSRFDKNVFLNQISSVSDLQGWRNKLVHSISNINFAENLRICDFGSGLGDKAFLASEIKESEQVIVLDYSSQAIEKSKNFIDKDNFRFVSTDINSVKKYIDENYIDVGFMFGFLHEVNDIKEALKNVKPVMKNNCLLVISDNSLSFNFYNLKNALSDNGYTYKVFKIKKFLFTFSFSNYLFINYRRHKNRADKLLAICSINKNTNIELFLNSFKKLH